MKQRVITALILAPIVLVALLISSPYPLIGLGFLVSILGSQEAAKLMRASSPGTYASTACVVYIAVIAVYLTKSTMSPLPIALGLVVVWLCSVIGANSVARNGKTSPLGILSVGWVISPLLALILIHQNDVGNTTWTANATLLALVPIWAGDTAAIFAGKAFGKHPLAPKISPKKTIEGGLANLIACIAMSSTLAHFLHYSLTIGIVIGCITGILGQAGDLFESNLKRHADLKDSGTLLPGHGGILDRIDSILFTAPFVALVLLALH